MNDKYSFVRKKINAVNKSFRPHPLGYKQAVLIADMIEDARLYRIGYCQDGQELRADYLGYVYDNSVVRRRERKRH